MLRAGLSKDSPTNVMIKEVDRTLSLDRRNMLCALCFYVVYELSPLLVLSAGMSNDSPTNVMNKELDRTLSLDRRNILCALCFYVVY